MRAEPLIGLFDLNRVDLAGQSGVPGQFLGLDNRLTALARTAGQAPPCALQRLFQTGAFYTQLGLQLVLQVFGPGCDICMIFHGAHLIALAPLLQWLYFEHMLNYTLHGDIAPTAERPALLIVHGLFGSGRNWGVIAKRLSDTRQVVTVDMRNHGQSPRAETQTYPDMADDLAEVITHLGAPMDICGHSMGGKAAMVLALTQPSLLRRLIVADIAPMAYAHTQTMFIDAMRQVDLSALTRRSDATAQLAAAGVEPALQSFFTQSLDVPGKRWQLNLDVLEAEMPKIIGWPDAITGRFTGPTLFLSGGASDYVRGAHRPVIKTHFPAARFASLPGAGHWLHAEKPRDFEATLRVTLDTPVAHS